MQNFCFSSFGNPNAIEDIRNEVSKLSNMVRDLTEVKEGEGKLQNSSHIGKLFFKILRFKICSRNYWVEKWI